LRIGKSIIPSLSEKESLSDALLFVGATKYKWEDQAWEEFAKQNTNNTNATYYPNGELVISKDRIIINYKANTQIQPNKNHEKSTLFFNFKLIYFKYYCSNNNTKRKGF
jgi:hypothetical protein